MKNLNKVGSLKRGLIGIGVSAMLSLTVTSAFAEDTNNINKDIITPNCKQYALFLQTNSEVMGETMDKTSTKQMNPIDAYILYNTMSNGLDKLNPLNFCDKSNTKDIMIITADKQMRVLLKEGKRMIHNSLNK